MKIVYFFILLFLIIGCKNSIKSNHKNKIYAEFKLMNRILEKKICMTNLFKDNSYNNEYRKTYLVNIKNNTNNDVFIPCYKVDCDTLGMKVLCVFYDTLFYKKKLTQTQNYKKRYYYTFYEKIKKYDNQNFVFKIETNDFARVNIDSVIYDISYIDKYDTIKQYIYFAKSNVDEYPW